MEKSNTKVLSSFSAAFLFSPKNVNSIRTAPITKSIHQSLSTCKRGKWEYTHYLAEYDHIIYLSKRQAECLLLLGYTQKKMAEKLGLSRRTVEYYLQKLKEKLNCKNKNDLLNLATKIKAVTT